MMDKKDIISKLAGYKLEGDIEGREKTIELGYEIMIRLEMSRHSYFELFLSTFRFIHVHTCLLLYICILKNSNQKLLSGAMHNNFNNMLLIAGIDKFISF